jgi:hypothetical protein
MAERRMSQVFERAIAAIDALNAQDPREDPYEAGQSFESAYSRRMSRWLERLAPEASEALQLAARAQHLARWRIPRKDYPMDRAGYKRWRADLGAMHAQATGEILREAGYGDETIERVQSLLKKKNLKTDPECQTLEDVICLVFLESYFADFAAQHDEQKLIRILQRTWAKMSERGHKAALELPLPPDLAKLVNKALPG